MLAFKTTTVEMPSTKGTTSVASGRVAFNSEVRTADIALKGFTVKFDNQHDHHFGQLDIFLREISVHNKSVSFSAFVMLRDFSGSIDDSYSGFVDVLVIADLADQSPVTQA